MSAPKKILNDPNNAAADMLDGLVEAYDGEVVKVGTASLVRTEIPDGKVALLVGGGSGTRTGVPRFGGQEPPRRCCLWRHFCRTSSERDPRGGKSG